MENYELYHYGIKGQKWGVRHYQNKDGSRTPAGKKRYPDRQPFVKANKTANKGQETASKFSKRKVLNMVANTAAVTSGALMVTSMLVPGAPALASIATTARIASTATGAANAATTMLVKDE